MFFEDVPMYNSFKISTPEIRAENNPDIKTPANKSNLTPIKNAILEKNNLNNLNMSMNVQNVDNIENHEDNFLNFNEEPDLLYKNDISNYFIDFKTKNNSSNGIQDLEIKNPKLIEKDEHFANFLSEQKLSNNNM